MYVAGDAAAETAPPAAILVLLAVITRMYVRYVYTTQQDRGNSKFKFPRMIFNFRLSFSVSALPWGAQGPSVQARRSTYVLVVFFLVINYLQLVGHFIIS